MTVNQQQTKFLIAMSLVNLILQNIFFLLQSDVEEGSNYISGHTEKLNENSFIDTIIINHIFVTLLNIIYWCDTKI